MRGRGRQARVSGAGGSLRGQLLASVPVVSALEPGAKVLGPPGLLGREEGRSDGVPQAPGVGLQQDGGAGRQLQGAGGQGGGRLGALRRQQPAARGGEAELPLERVVGREEGALRGRLVEEKGDEAQDRVRGLERGEKG